MHGARTMVGWALLLLALGCEGARPDNPFTTTSSGTGGSGGEGGEGGGGDDPELGGPCVEDAQCDDGLDCTSDRCDPSLARCRFTPDATVCDDGVHCNGPERCDGKLGCVLGDPVDCGDLDPCTIDTCVESTKSCSSVPRDADEDGDPDSHCGGGDCDDLDPLVSSTGSETCGNLVDDDCDDSVDEPECTSPQYDTCLDPLLIDADGLFALSTDGAGFSYATSCAPMGTLRDVVGAVVLPAGAPIDVVARAKTGGAAVSVAMAAQCGDPASELACSASYQLAGMPGQVSRIRARSVGGGMQSTNVPLYVTTVGASDVALSVSFEPATTAPTNETCGTADDLTPGTVELFELVDAATDLDTACARATGELVYRLVLTEASDLDLWATSTDGDGNPAISLRDSDCALEEDEIACNTGPAAHVFRHALPAGEYFVAVSATAPTDVSLLAALSPPSPPPEDEDCSSVAELTPGQTVDVDFDGHQDDHQLGCFQAAVDAAYRLQLSASSDVLLVQRITSGDSGSVQLSESGCTPSDLLACKFGAKSPLRARDRGVPAGDYRVLAESLLGLPQQVTAFVRPSAPTQLVPFSDACADAMTIPSTGGFFKGNTSNSIADYPAGCDQSGSGPGGAPDQLMKLVLPAPKRVVLDMTGSQYATLLSVRKGPSCPGTEVALGCSAGIGGDTSFLDLSLDAGTYYVQLDGLGGATGPWTLDVHVADP